MKVEWFSENIFSGGGRKNGKIEKKERVKNKQVQTKKRVRLRRIKSWF